MIEPLNGSGKPESFPAITWAIRPFEGQPIKLLVVFAAAFLALGVGWFGFRQPLFGILGFAMILGSTAEYWLGSTFRLDEKGASARTGLSVTAMEWSDVKRILVKGHEIRLSPLESPSNLDAFRGVGLVTTSENREAVASFIQSRVADGVSCTL